MRRLLAHIMVVGLMGASTSVTLAAAPSPSPSAMGQRVEVPEVGIAMTVPEDWSVRVLMQEADVEPEFASCVSNWHVMDVLDVYDYPEVGTSGCSLFYLRTSDRCAGTVTLDDVIRLDAGSFYTDPGFDGAYTTTEVELPAGPASRVDFVEHDYDGDWHGAVYRLAAPDGAVRVICTGFDARPEDDWLSIVETFEVLPDGSVPAARFGITFPGHWTVREPTSEEVGSMFRGFPDEERPLLRARLLAERPGSDETCRVVDRSAVEAVHASARSIEEVMAADIAAIEAAFGQAVNDSAIVGLPAGRAGRIDVLLDDTIAISWYHIADGRSWFYLQCGSREPPEDRWLSIAQTFEFLPVE